MSLTAYLTVSGALFLCGLLCVITRRNAIAVLIGIELILNAAGLNFAAFNHFHGGTELDGQMFALFIIVLAAVEAVAAFAIVVAVYKSNGHVEIDKLQSLKY